MRAEWYWESCWHIAGHGNTGSLQELRIAQSFCHLGKKASCLHIQVLDFRTVTCQHWGSLSSFESALWRYFPFVSPWEFSWPPNAYHSRQIATFYTHKLCDRQITPSHSVLASSFLYPHWNLSSNNRKFFSLSALVINKSWMFMTASHTQNRHLTNIWQVK